MLLSLEQRCHRFLQDELDTGSCDIWHAPALSGDGKTEMYSGDFKALVSLFMAALSSLESSGTFERWSPLTLSKVSTTGYFVRGASYPAQKDKPMEFPSDVVDPFEDSEWVAM